MKFLKRFLCVTALAASFQAHAIPIDGTFFLNPAVNQVTGVPTGELLSGTFTYDPDNAMTSAVTGAVFTAITDFSIFVPPAPNQELTLVDFTDGPNAILSAIGSPTVLGLQGFAIKEVAGVTYSLDLTADPGVNAASTFTSSGGSTPGQTYSGVQVIPEPNVLALFGAGLVGFGLFARRNKIVK